MLIGIYKTYDELEESLSIDEVNRITAALHKRENENRKFTAALKGIKLGEEDDREAYNAVKRRAEARRRGISVEELEMSELGIKYE